MFDQVDSCGRGSNCMYHDRAHVRSQYLKVPILSLAYFHVGTIVGLTTIIFNQLFVIIKSPYCRDEAFCLWSSVQISKRINCQIVPVAAIRLVANFSKIRTTFFRILSCHVKGTALKRPHSKWSDSNAAEPCAQRLQSRCRPS